MHMGSTAYPELRASLRPEMPELEIPSFSRGMYTRADTDVRRGSTHRDLNHRRIDVDRMIAPEDGTNRTPISSCMFLELIGSIKLSRFTAVYPDRPVMLLAELLQQPAKRAS
jgi:hypothetical protein